MSQDNIDINVYETVDEVTISIVDNVNVININRIASEPFDPSDYDLDEFTNDSVDPFVRESDLPLSDNSKLTANIPISTNSVATNNSNHTILANVTLTDPTIIDTGFYMVTALNGTVTIDAVTYPIGTILQRHFADGVWSSTVVGGNEIGGELIKVIADDFGTEIIGYRLKGFDPNNFGVIGEHAIDLSKQTQASFTRGSTGFGAFSAGINNTSSGETSFSVNLFNQAIAQWSAAFGESNIANGTASFVWGQGNLAKGYAEMSGGTYGTDYTFSLSSEAKLFNLGNGILGNRSDAFSVFRNGAVRIFRATLASITNAMSGMLIFDSGNSNRPTIHNGTEWKALAYEGEGGGTSLIREQFDFASSQTITLANDYAQVYSVEVSGQGALKTSQYNLVAPNQITFLDTLETGDYIVVIYSAQAVGVNPYYTQSQVDLIAETKQNSLGYTPPRTWFNGENGATVANTLTITPTYTQLIPANTFVAGDVVEIQARATSPAAKTSSSSLILYVNTAPDLSGTPLQLAIRTLSASARTAQMRRNLAVKGSTTRIGVVVNSAGLVDDINEQSGIPLLTIDWTVDQHFIFAISHTVADQTLFGDFYKIIKM